MLVVYLYVYVPKGEFIMIEFYTKIVTTLQNTLLSLTNAGNVPDTILDKLRNDIQYYQNLIESMKVKPDNTEIDEDM